MSPRAARARASRGKRSRSSGRVANVLAIVADLVLAAVVVIFGFSIAGHFDPGRPRMTESVRHARDSAHPGGKAPETGKNPSGEKTPPAGKAPAGGNAASDGPSSHEAGAAAQPAGSPGDLRSRPTVEVRNGSTRPKLAEAMRDRLLGSGFDVVDCRNADRHDYAKTLIRGGSGPRNGAERLRDYLRKEYGVGEISSAPGASRWSDLVLILGADLADTLAHREKRLKGAE